MTKCWNCGKELMTDENNEHDDNEGFCEYCGNYQ